LGSDSKDVVCEELSFLCKENEELGKMLDNHDDMLERLRR
jgi:hypothetical protein